MEEGLERRRDWSSRSGASDLGRTIQRYWESRGYLKVQVTVEPISDYDNTSYFILKSNIVNGVPPR